MYNSVGMLLSKKICHNLRFDKSTMNQISVLNTFSTFKCFNLDLEFCAIGFMFHHIHICA